MGRFYAITKYDENKNPIMTSLFEYGKFVIALSGWHNTDEMAKYFLKKIITHL